MKVAQIKQIEHLRQCHKELHRLIDKYEDCGDSQASREDVARLISKLSHILAKM